MKKVNIYPINRYKKGSDSYDIEKNNNNNDIVYINKQSLIDSLYICHMEKLVLLNL